MNELDKLKLEYETNYPIIQGYREISFETWLIKEVIDLREQVKLFTTPVIRKRALTDYMVVLILGGSTFLTALFHFIKSMFF